LVFARGHRIDRIPEVPLVVDEKTVAQISKTKNAVAFLKKIHAYADVEKVIASKTLRAGRGKMRNRRYVKRRGPLIIYNDKTIPLLRALRNIPGVEFVSVHRLNLLKLAPGGHLGRFVIWTRDAFVQLDKLYGTYKRPSKLKHGYSLPRSALTNSDLGRLINSAEVQSHLHRKKKVKKYVVHKKNALTNLGYLIKLNPYAKVQRRQSILATLNAGKRRRTAKAEHEKLKAARKQKKEKRDAEAKTKTGTKTQAKRLSHRQLFVKTLLS
jgi:large subunit ribosomal protein L4e